MGALGSLTGLAGGSNGAGVAGPSLAPVINPVTGEQTKQAYGQTQDAITQQEEFVRALQAQNGIGNQQSVFNQLQGVANGTGPNPAQAMLAQQTGTNVANQASLMAGQRGSSANVGLIGRQAAQVGGGLQQQAIGQGATMQANQSLNALNSLGSIATNQVNQQQGALTGYNQAAQGQQQNLLGAIQGVNNANVSSQNSVNSANTALIQGSQASQAGLLKGVGGALMNVAPKVAGLFGGAAGGTAMAGGAGDAIASAAPLVLAAAHGGLVKNYADGGNISTSAPQIPAIDTATTEARTMGAQSSFGKRLENIKNDTSAPLLDANMSTQNKQMSSDMQDTGGSLIGGLSGLMGGGAKGATDVGSSASLALLKAQGGKVPALVSPGEQYLKPNEVKEVVKDGKNPLETGERIPGTPKVKGNSYANDTVPKTLEAGGIVIPNSVMQSKDPAKAAAKFVAAHCRSLKKDKK